MVGTDSWVNNICKWGWKKERERERGGEREKQKENNTLMSDPVGLFQWYRTGRQDPWF